MRLILLLLAAGLQAGAQDTNHVAATNAPPEVPPPSADVAPPAHTNSDGYDEAAFRIVAERNIFNANRSGTVIRSSTRRAGQIDYFTLVGTMAYEKGAFAFFEGSSSEFTKVLKPESVIAGHKLADIYTDGVKLDFDGKSFDLPIGSQLRREDQGAWHVTMPEGGGPGFTAATSGDSSSRYGRSDRDRSRGDSRNRRGSDSSSSRTTTTTSPAQPAAATPAVDEAEVLKRLMERREKEAQ